MFRFRFRFLLVFSVIALLGACSHSEPNKTSRSNPLLGKSFSRFMKSKVFSGPDTDKRFPATSNESYESLDNFLAAVKVNPAYLKAPIGFEVISESTSLAP